MITATHNKIIVSVDFFQKEEILIGDTLFRMAHKFEHNLRYSSPVICKVEEGNDTVFKGDVLLVHHNLLTTTSPYRLYDNIFSVPFSKVLFAKIMADGDLFPICDNVLGVEVEKKYIFDIPVESKEKYKDRIIITHAGLSRFKKGQTVFTRANAPYSIEMLINGVHRSVIKVSTDMVIGYAKNHYGIAH